jgi:hypothetical protein
LLTLSEASRLAAPSVGALTKLPAFAARWSTAAVPLASPRRQWLTGASVATAWA